MKTFVKQNTWLKFSPHGWGNGYVVIPKGHPLHGVDYTEIDVDVHGGLTFSDFAKDLDWPEIPKGCKTGWVVGFDTAHYDDSLARWSKESVMTETENLKEQLINYKL
jgi:hypothetical protein